MAWNPFSSEKTIDDLKEKDIQAEIVKLEVEEQQISRKIRGMEAEENKILDIAAESNGSDVDDRIASRKVSQVRADINEAQVRAQVITDRLMALSRIMATKKSQKELEAKGLWSDISGMELGKLGDKLTDMAVEDASSKSRTREIIDILGVDSAQVQNSEPAELRSIQQEIAAKRKANA